MTSRSGGTLIPFHHITVELKESSAGLFAGSATVRSHSGILGLKQFSDATRGFELLIRLLQEEEPMPQIFSASVAFLQACSEGVPHASLAFSIRVLHLLGLLAAESHITSSIALTGAEREYLEMAREGYFLRETELRDCSKLERMMDKMIEGQLTSPLKAPKVVSAMNR